MSAAFQVDTSIWPNMSEVYGDTYGSSSVDLSPVLMNSQASLPSGGWSTAIYRGGHPAWG